MKNFNYFSENEQKGQEKFRTARDNFFNKPAKMLFKLGLSANTVSLIGLLQVIPFGFFIFFQDGKFIYLSLLFLFLHLLFDALDGAVARLSSNDGDHGSFIDMLVDHSGMVSIVFITALTGFSSGIIGIAYTYTYTILVIYIIILNIQGSPIPFIIRSKYIYYFLVTLLILTEINILNIMMSLFTAYHLIFISMTTKKVYTCLKESHEV